MINQGVIILIAFLLGYLLDNAWAYIHRKYTGKKHDYNDFKKIIIKRIRVHHNMIGYILIIIGFFYYPILLVPGGLGMIMGHKIRDNLFWFIEH